MTVCAVEGQILGQSLQYFSEVIGQKGKSSDILLG